MIKKITNNSQYIGFKFFTAFIVFAMLILSAILVIHLTFSKAQQNDKFKERATAQSHEKLTYLNSFLNKRIDSLKAVASNPYFQEFVYTNNYTFNTEFLFYTIMEENKEYMQLRFIDDWGLEKLRFDRKIYGESSYKVKKLQDKKMRYYFQKTKQLKNGEIFISKIDFNKEFGKIQKPYVPVLRIATPIYEKKIFRGIFIINIFISDFLEIFTASPIYDIYLTTTNGYLVKDKKQLYDWTIQSRHLKDIFDKSSVKKILTTTNEKILYDKKLFIRKIKLGRESFFLIYSIKKSQIEKNNLNSKKMGIVILLFALFISIVFGYLMSRPPKKIFDFIAKQSDELHSLASTLEKRVEEETLKNAKKDRLLQHQSKMAELGDMIGNIAHQWRHPLTRLSLLLQNLKAYKNKNKMSDEIFFNTLENANEQIEFMSDTIDNFKDFYKTDKIKSQFKIQDCLTDIFKIINSILEHNDIKVTILDDEEIELDGIKNQFSQVLLNLIVNAKDALVDKEIKAPTINIEIYLKDNKKIITIEDNAGGIPTNILNDIFDPYFTTKDKKGTGIGLYLSRTIIEHEFNGNLSVKNSSQGAVFKIVL
ncbi:MAG: sensor histidine kinase [Arcobacteraceae bacterium]|nr:sensor histidine kinase [Arcobacteraceae bacterium]